MFLQPTELTLWSDEHIRLAISAAGIAFWSWDVDTDRLTLDGHGFDLWGVSRSSEVTFAELSERIHPADRDRVRAAFIATSAVIGPYEIDFRILVDDNIRWVSARGQGNEAGIVGRTMFGVFLDVTGRKQAEEGNELMAGEMSHRVKNLLAVASGLTAITSRSTNSTKDMARELIQRLSALGRAHDLVRPLRSQDGKAALLGDLLTVLLAPYDDLGAFSGRIRVSVPRMGVGEATATTLALVMHELATNSVKYGALSSETGTLDISCNASEDEFLDIIWTERGGPLVSAPAQAVGYGSTLIARSMDQLDGALEYRWEPEGLIAILKVNSERLAR
ncbi:sensor histidine kinase [Microvirga antarctica]|uniref:sensor histidine kinase n=1 Tax=Microvirga antarctica TaxID=2819233 RepID=UPI001FE9E750|nr:sensor histidine kinase [Microvirga antarctica]